MSRLIWYFLLSIIPVMLLLPGEPSNALRHALDPQVIARKLDEVGRTQLFQPQGQDGAGGGIGGFVTRLFSGAAKTSVTQLAEGETGKALDHVKYASFGWEGDESVLDSENGLPVFRARVITGWRKTALEDAPAAIVTHPLLTSCDALARPAPGDRVALVVSGARMKGGLIGRDATKFHKAVADYIKDMRSPLRRRNPAVTIADRKENAYDAFDVALTRSDAPVHLVLSGEAGWPRVWNLQIAPGARLARVTLLGGARDAVANLPDGVPVEAIGRDTLAACGAREAYPFEETSLIHQSAAIGALSQDEYRTRMAELDTAYRDWAAWFSARYGVEPLERQLGFDRGFGVVIGPVPATPEARATFRPLAGAAVSIAEGAQAIPISEAGILQMRAEVEAKAREIAGPAFDLLPQYPKRSSGGMF
ncbi:MAG: hypothetical protein AB7U46_13275 [Paenirhodobacter sp.]|uniref:hypothetical protein n=1 Tax=Paenirhodobacter sp. TaxID=1965326 RepID=UPI003D143F98